MIEFVKDGETFELLSPTKTEIKAVFEYTKLVKDRIFTAQNFSGVRYSYKMQVYNYTQEFLDFLKLNWQTSTKIRINSRLDRKANFYCPKMPFYEDLFNKPKTPFIQLELTATNYIKTGGPIITAASDNIFSNNDTIFSNYE